MVVLDNAIPKPLADALQHARQAHPQYVWYIDSQELPKFLLVARDLIAGNYAAKVVTAADLATAAEMHVMVLEDLKSVAA